MFDFVGPALIKQVIQLNLPENSTLQSLQTSSDDTRHDNFPTTTKITTSPPPLSSQPNARQPAKRPAQSYLQRMISKMRTQVDNSLGGDEDDAEDGGKGRWSIFNFF